MSPKSCSVPCVVATADEPSPRHESQTPLVDVADRQTTRSNDEPDAVILNDLDRVVSTVGDDMDRLLGASLLLTGGSGFIGRSILESVLRFNGLGRGRPCAITVLTSRPDLIRLRYASQVDAGQVTVIPWGRRFATELDDERFDYIIHAGAPTDLNVIRAQPIESLDATIEMAAAITRVAKTSPIRRFVLISSGAVYGRQPADVEAIPETWDWSDQAEPASTYAEGKRAAERLCRQVPADVKIARVFSALGPYQSLDSGFAVPSLISASR